MINHDGATCSVRCRQEGGSIIAGQRTLRALDSLQSALTRLESAASLNAEAHQASAASADELARLAEDRALLAARLDAEQARADRLSAASREVEGRLVSLMDAIRKQGMARP